MNCPVCGKEMEKGGVSHLMRSDFGEKLFWVSCNVDTEAFSRLGNKTSRARHRRRQGQRLSLSEDFFEELHILTKRTVERAGGKVFSIGRSIFDNEPRYSWYCRSCELILTDIKNKR